MAISPYQNQPVKNWPAITERLINAYPLPLSEILEIATLAWDKLWSTNIGGDINIIEADLSAQLIGSFFQKLFSHELARRYPNDWRGEISKTDKDLVNLNNIYFSTEMKVSGQKGYKLFGNRSYNQETMNSDMSGKDKSGYYITMNYYKQSMTRLRIGWIDQVDWKPQSAATGQAATLYDEVYEHKLVDIRGSYILNTPVEFLNKVGPAALVGLHSAGVFTFNDLRNYNGPDLTTQKLKAKHIQYLQTL